MYHTHFSRRYHTHFSIRVVSKRGVKKCVAHRLDTYKETHNDREKLSQMYAVECGVVCNARVPSIHHVPVLGNTRVRLE